MTQRWTRSQIAQRAARDLPAGACVNLGIGLPTLIASLLPAAKAVALHSENGILRFGPPPEGPADPSLIDASKQPVGLRPGAAIFDSTLSFAIMRGGHLDVAVLGSYEVSATGDLANWNRGDPEVPPAIGGAMDLAYGARSVWVLMEHTTKDARPRIVRRCRLPLTAVGVVRRIYTDVAVLEVGAAGLELIELADGWTFDELQAITDAPVVPSGAARVA